MLLRKSNGLKLNSLSSAYYGKSNDTEDDIVLSQTIISELDKLFDLKG